MSHQQTIEKIKKDLSDNVFVIDALRDTFKGKTALVISAGPSAESWKEIYEKEKHNCPVVICIKQTLNLIDVPCDIHFINSANLIKYEYQSNTLSVMTRNSKAAPVFGKYDVGFKIMEGFNYKPRYYLATNKCFDCYTLDKTGIYRPLGPGIMHESVFYTLVHMGFKRIVTIGWDVADSTGGNRHFGEVKDKGQDKPYESSKVKIKIKKILSYFKLESIYGKIGFSKRYVKGFINYYLGNKVNLAGMAIGEAEIVSSSIESLKKWLQKNDVILDINSHSGWVNKGK
ncbi:MULTISPECIES: 6-hydroxymethylpterin diphosphokinase MptE-like protein [unclassified Oceanobacter]|uniref:6-hydroxymethylpterin diphosphokinase MptE-like protein n=1 Tax=unclassified Oceanobacter TaxID=2620260 RepID=UPI002732E13D|nr:MULTISPECIES: 6-hydroxymethylpterin diphosphokinase MptE-like protein [unclassified Oceanobacter]MDP2608076.1 DUF115 domain-containing protein [Oceanobacter sp. 1_MG-2023]MDP2611262.1 DUF115 domain-containing protein [Oceanobacter sp. 2_MG-2023]